MFDPSTASLSRAWVEVRLDHLRENALATHRALIPGARLLPMVKADGYGLGMDRVARALRDVPPGEGPWAFGVATVAEGEALRASGWDGRLIVFSPAAPGEFERAADAGLTLCLSDLAGARRWRDAAAALGRTLAFHVEVDTGMGRAGFPWEAASAWGAELAALAGDTIRWEGCFTHFHSADEPDPEPTRRQWERFRSALERVPGAGDLVVHVANSAAAVRFGGFQTAVARPGIFLYGGGVGAEVRPRPVAAVRARIALVREVEPGTSVGYGATYRATRRERWGTLTIGYGDGLARALATGGGGALVRGRRVPLIGRISMDVATVDLTRVPEARAGDVATLIGRDGEAEITLDEVAERCGTISYEVLTRLSPRLPRVYLEGPEEGWPG